MRGVPHSDDTRAAVLAALLAGQSVHEVATTFKLNRSTVIQWRAAAGLDATLVQPQKREEIGELVYTYLQQTLITLAVQAGGLSDTEWIKKYSPSEAATLFGVMSDKGFRLLEAIQAANASNEPSEPSS